MVFIRMTGEVNAIDIVHGHLNIKDERGADYMIIAEANQLTGIAFGDKVEVEVEWARGKASSVKCIERNSK
jgi:hypothetical protein